MKHLTDFDAVRAQALSRSPFFWRVVDGNTFRDDRTHMADPSILHYTRGKGYGRNLHDFFLENSPGSLLRSEEANVDDIDDMVGGDSGSFWFFVLVPLACVVRHRWTTRRKTALCCSPQSSPHSTHHHNHLDIPLDLVPRYGYLSSHTSTRRSNDAHRHVGGSAECPLLFWIQILPSSTSLPRRPASFETFVFLKILSW